MTTASGAGPEGRRIVRLEEVDSTNAEAMRLVVAGERGPLWIRADRQLSGRGRSGRTWMSQPGNLFASYVCALDVPLGKAGQLSLVAGLALVDAVARAGSVDGLRLKWPNDILIGQAKAGGILVESTSRPPQPGIVAVVGTGLNLVSAPENLGRSATFLAAAGISLSPDEALCFLAQTMDDWMNIWDRGRGFAHVRDKWLDHAGPIGEALTVNAGAGPVSGRFAGLDDEGALLLDVDDGRQLSFSFGDVTLAAKDTHA